MLTEATGPILQWLNTNPQWSGLLTFVISAAESVAVIGTIVPGTIMMTAIGTLVGAGIIPFWGTLLWAIAGAIVGDGISYWMGYYFKDSLHTIWPFRKHPGMLENGERFFKKHGTMSVFIGRFVGPVRALVPVVAGMFGVKPLRFTIANILSAIGWAPIYMLPGIILGAASLELPPDMATQVVVTLMLITLLVILCIWFFKKALSLIHNQINQFLNWIWQSLKKSRHFHVVASILKHHNLKQTPNQLILVFYLFIFLTLFLMLGIYIKCVNPQSIMVNDVFFHLFRSLHTPTANQVMTGFTMLGQKKFIFSIAAVIFVWLAFTKRWYTAWHVFALTLLTGASIEVTKHWVHSPRPWGITQSPADFSFPSGHSILTAVFFISFALLLSNIFKLKCRWPLFTFFGLIVALVGASRIYLGAHWFTDVTGAWLLSAILLILISLSYNRNTERRPIDGRKLILIVGIAAIAAYGVTLYRDYSKTLHDSKPIDWPVNTISLDAWWQHKGENVPLYRLNRFGIAQQVLNLQWIGNLQDIKNTLLQNGWQLPSEQDWITVLQRVADVKSSEHLPLVSPLYLDKKPVLVLIKNINGDKKLIVLRLWESNLKFNNTTLPFWVGAVEITPRTYGWLFKKTSPRKISLTPDLLFTKTPTNLDIKQFTVTTKYDKEALIILLKPKNVH